MSYNLRMLIAQITDFHVGHQFASRKGKVDTLQPVSRAVAHLNALEPAPDLVLATGDLTETGQFKDYEDLKGVLSQLRMPVYVIPGNHDRRQNLRAAFSDHRYLPATGEFLHYVVEDYPLRLIGLDTLDPSKENGRMCEERLSWFEARLAEAPKTPTLVFMHHPPFTTGLQFFDRMGLQGAEDMGAIVARNSQIQGIVCGHVHRAIHIRWHGTVASIAPSTSFQYPLDMRDVEDVEPLHEPPACRLCAWIAETGLVSHLSYIGTCRTNREMT